MDYWLILQLDLLPEIRRLIMIKYHNSNRPKINIFRGDITILNDGVGFLNGKILLVEDIRTVKYDNIFTNKGLVYKLNEQNPFADNIKKIYYSKNYNLYITTNNVFYFQGLKYNDYPINYDIIKTYQSFGNISIYTFKIKVDKVCCGDNGCIIKSDNRFFHVKLSMPIIYEGECFLYLNQGQIYYYIGDKADKILCQNKQLGLYNKVLRDENNIFRITSVKTFKYYSNQMLVLHLDHSVKLYNDDGIFINQLQKSSFDL